jgi:hypothetical protein
MTERVHGDSDYVTDMGRCNAMKRHKKLIIVGVAVFLLVVGNTAASETVAENPSEEVKIVAYYFHGTFRCPSCTKIEKWSYGAITDSFPEALEEGRLLWRAVNVEEPKNKHFVKQYDLFTKSLIITEMKGEKQIRWKNLSKVWEFLGNQEKFLSYVTQEVKGYLEN